MGKELKILLLENDPKSASCIKNIMQEALLEFNLCLVSTKEKFMTGMLSFEPDLIISGDQLPDLNVMEALKLARSQYSDIPFIPVLDSASVKLALDCIAEGADDYVLKDRLVRLPVAIKNVLSRILAQQEKKEIIALHEELTVAYHEIEENNKSMTDSINYAKLIQEAMLPEKAVLTIIFLIH